MLVVIKEALLHARARPGRVVWQNPGANRYRIYGATFHGIQTYSRQLVDDLIGDRLQRLSVSEPP